MPIGSSLLLAFYPIAASTLQSESSELNIIRPLFQHRIERRSRTSFAVPPKVRLTVFERFPLHVKRPETMRFATGLQRHDTGFRQLPKHHSDPKRTNSPRPKAKLGRNQKYEVLNVAEISQAYFYLSDDFHPAQISTDRLELQKVSPVQNIQKTRPPKRGRAVVVVLLKLVAWLRTSCPSHP